MTLGQFGSSDHTKARFISLIKLLTSSLQILGDGQGLYALLSNCIQPYISPSVSPHALPNVMLNFIDTSMFYFN